MDSQIVIARNLGYLKESEACQLLVRIHEVGKILNGLLSSLEGARVPTSH